MDTIYWNGAVRTMEPGAPPAQALLTRDGGIAAVGDLEEVSAAAKGANKIDLAGGTLIPGFLDPHSHFSGVAVAKLQVSLQDAVSFDDIRARVAAFIAENHLPPGTWVTGQGYDHNRLAEGRHPDKALLDAAAPDHPVVLQHQSGHAGVFNSLALKELGITPNTPLPEGGHGGNGAGRAHRLSGRESLHRLCAAGAAAREGRFPPRLPGRPRRSTSPTASPPPRTACSPRSSLPPTGTCWKRTL